MSPKDGQSGDVNQQTSPKNLTEQPEQSEGANQQTPSKSPSLARPHIDFHFTTPTRASLAKSKEKVLLPCGRCERAEKVVDVPRPEKKRPRESVEVGRTLSYEEDCSRFRYILKHLPIEIVATLFFK